MNPFAPLPASPVPGSPQLAPLATQGEDVLSLFVSDLPLFTTEDDIHHVFNAPMEHLPNDAYGRVYIYPFCITDVRIVAGDGGMSKYAFVRFPSVSERTRALYIMQGVLCLGRPMRLSRAHSRDRSRSQVGLVLFTNQRTREERQRDNVAIDKFNAQWATVDPKNTKVFVGGVSPETKRTVLANRFMVAGTITNVNFGKGCAFVSYARKAEAQKAIDMFNGISFDGKVLRVTWSRSSVQPLLQQQRTLALLPDSENDNDNILARTPPNMYNGRSISPTSPVSPMAPITPGPHGNLALPNSANVTPNNRSPYRPTHSRNSSLTKGGLMQNLYTLREVEEIPSPLLYTSGSELAPGLARRQTIANIKSHFTAESPIKELSQRFYKQDLAPSLPLARRVSLPDNAL